MGNLDDLHDHFLTLESADHIGKIVSVKAHDGRSALYDPFLSVIGLSVDLPYPGLVVAHIHIAFLQHRTGDGLCISAEGHLNNHLAGVVDGIHILADHDAHAHAGAAHPGLGVGSVSIGGGDHGHGLPLHLHLVLHIHSAVGKLAVKSPGLGAKKAA